MFRPLGVSASAVLSLALLGCGGGATPAPEGGAPGADVAGADVRPDAGEGDAAAGPCGDLAACGARCVDLQTDPSACGACGTACEPTEACEEGACVCAGGRERCGLDCVDTLEDPDHCGACGVACGSEERCREGVCVLQCDLGLTACEGACVDLQTDLDHCGACGDPCVAGVDETSACEAGRCARTCEPGAFDLDGAPGCEYRCAPSEPGPERCDGEDNDCDGRVDAADPDYVPPACPKQDGVCAGSVFLCADGALRGCADDDYAAWASESGQRYSPDEERSCEGVDNDCDGGIDEPCCAEDAPPFVVPSLNDNTRDDWYTLRTWNLIGADGEVVTSAFLGAESRDESPEWRFGFWRLDGDRPVGEPVGLRRTLGYSVGASIADDAVTWWTAAGFGVETGSTRLDGSLLSPFTLDPDIDLPAEGLSSVEVAPSGEGYLLTAVVASEAGERLVLGDFRGLRGVWRFADTGLVSRVVRYATWRTPTRRHVCAIVRDGGAQDALCWVFDQELAELAVELLPNAPSLASLGPFVPTGDGGAVLYVAAADEACDPTERGFCNEPLIEVRVTPDGALQTRSLGRTSYAGYVEAFAGHGGSAWVFVAEPEDAEDAIGLLALYHVVGDAWTRAARWDFREAYPNVPYGLGAGVLYDEEGMPWAVTRAVNLSGDEPALTVWPISREGVCLQP